MRRFALILALSTALTGPGSADSIDSSAGPIAFTPIVTGLEEPWALAFLPGGGFLITERDGRLWAFDRAGGRQEITGLPEIAVGGQGGLLDVLVPRDFASRQEIFFTFSQPQSRGAGTALARARLAGNQLEDLTVIWSLEPGSSGGRHFGSRIVEGRDGYLYVTIGDRGDRPSAQDLGNENGTVIRVARDGSIPSDNPFTGQAGAQPEIWSYGHRNPQGAALDPSGQLWVVEHGARGGDEVNEVRRGANYGWPVIAYGRHYSGFRIGQGTEAPGMEQPAHYWDPSIAPSGMAFYEGDLFPQWRGDLLVGALAFDLISRLDPDQGMAEVERIEAPETARVRDVRVAPDGSIWFLSVGNGALYRMAPEGR